MSQIKSLTDQIVAFRDARDWKQFHNGKDLALSLNDANIPYCLPASV